MLTLSLLGYLKTRIDPPPSKSHVRCLNMTNDTFWIRSDLNNDGLNNYFIN